MSNPNQATMASKIEPLQRSKSMRLSAEDLSYQCMTVENNGKVINNEQKEKLREKHGYCTTCVGAPILCMDITKSRINPLWNSKEPRTVDGECFEGICLKCQPEKDPRRQRYAMTKGGSSRSAPSRKDIHRDLSNGSLALSQSRRDLFRASQSRIGRDHPVKREASTTSIGSVGTLGSATSLASSNSSSFHRRRPSIASSNLSSASNHQRVPVPTSHSPGRRASLIPTASKPPTKDFQRSYSGSISEATPQQRFPFLKPPSQSSLSSTECSTSHDDPLSLEDSAAVLLERAISTGTSISSSFPASTGHVMQPEDLTQAGTEQQAHCTSAQSNSPGTTTSSTVTTITEDAPMGGVSNNGAVANLRELFKGLSDASNFDIVVDVLVSNIQSDDREEFKVVCLEEIASICKEGNKEHVEQLIRSNIVEDVVFAMKNFSESKAVQLRASEAIACLAKNQDACSALVESSVCRLLIRIPQRFREDSTVARKALQALSAIAALVPSALVKDGDCFAFLKILQDSENDPSILQETMKVLRTLTSDSSAREYFRSANASNYVCETMSKHLSNVPLQLAGCAFLCNVSINEATNHESSVEVSVVSCGVMKAIVEALREHKGQTKLVKIACTALQSLTCEQRNVRILAGLEGVFDVFADDGDMNNKIPDCPEADVVLERLQIALFA